MGSNFSSMLTQFFPPKPQFTESSLPSLAGKVYIVTGANTGVGKDVARILYSKNAKVYVAGRSESKCNAAIEDIKSSHPASSGSLSYLHLDLNDLSTVKASAEQFLSQESKLHVLFNNAGVQSIKSFSRTAQGYEQHIGVNTIAPFLFTKLLTPTLAATAKADGSPTRVVWASSAGTETSGLPSIGLDVENLDYSKSDPGGITRYALSKAGNWLHAVEYVKRYEGSDIISVPLNPGNLRSDLYRDAPLAIKIMEKLVMYPALNGAYTELYAGLSPDITMKNTGCWVIPFGRIGEIRKDLQEAVRSPEEGGNGNAAKFWDWTEEQVKMYAS
ncbi:short-chain dehydrogenase [Xylariaceae sp. FL1019]|nr:short-chain dehydrogenase [Xylariaceae sp. FL1019]